MEQRPSPAKQAFFNRFTATKDRPLPFQIIVFILVLLVVAIALTTALLHL